MRNFQIVLEGTCPHPKKGVSPDTLDNEMLVVVQKFVKDLVPVGFTVERTFFGTDQEPEEEDDARDEEE